MEKAPHEQGFLVYQIYADLHKAGFYDTEPALFFSSIPLPFCQTPQSPGIQAVDGPVVHWLCTQREVEVNAGPPLAPQHRIQVDANGRRERV